MVVAGSGAHCMPGPSQAHKKDGYCLGLSKDTETSRQELGKGSLLLQSLPGEEVGGRHEGSSFIVTELPPG